MSVLHVLLPPLERCRAQGMPAAWQRRGDRLADAEPGYLNAVAEHFTLPGGRVPVAALTRQALAGDAAGSSWLCVDPAYVQAELAGARLMACGNIDLLRDEAEALAAGLRPLFGDRGYLLETTTPSHWHLRLPEASQPPAFATPEAAMGEDLLQHLPQGVEGKRWRALFNEVQVSLHQHPLNAERRGRGQVPANSVWFWGGGTLPMWVKADVQTIYSHDVLLQALGGCAGIDVASPDAFESAGDADVLLDLETEPDLQSWWSRIDAALRRRVDVVHLAFASGERVQVKRWHRLRFWRRG